MATLQSAKEKYARAAPKMAANWNAAKGRMTGNYGPGMSRFLGAPVSPQVVSNFQAGVANAPYRPGDPDKWANNLVAKMTGR